MPSDAEVQEAGNGRAPPTLAVGEVVAERYRIVRFIARGGMGSVYEAEDLVVGGHLGLKTIRPEIAARPKAVERFKREIHLARKITHPNVSRIYDLGTYRPRLREDSSEPAAEMIFLTMELLSGPTLAEKLEESGTFDTGEALPLVEQMCAGLDAAHRLGIIHRDFKSSNVILAPAAERGGGTRAVVTDFGLARSYAADSSLATLSEAGDLLGTPAYMAPEQLEGKELTPAADIYSLGIVLYEMVTGVRPFSSPLVVAAKRLSTTPPPPRELKPRLDPRWQDVIMRCLEIDPEIRFGRVSDIPWVLRGELDIAEAPTLSLEATKKVTPSAAASRSPWRISVRWPVLGAMLVLIAAGVGVLVDRWRAATAPRATEAGMDESPATVRRSLAVREIVGPADDSESSWLSTAIAEMLESEFNLGRTIRVLSGREIADVARNIGLDSARNLDPDSTRRLDAALAVDLAVNGSYELLKEQGLNLVRLKLEVQDLASGESVALSEATGSVGQLFDVVMRAGEPLRRELGLEDLTPAQALELRASLPSNPEAARLYVEGIQKLRRQEFMEAREIFEDAVAEAPDHPLPYSGLASAWSELGNRLEGSRAATAALERAEAFSREERLALEAQAHAISQRWDEAVNAYQSLFRAFPDDLELGLRLAETQIAAAQPREAMVTLDRLRTLPSPISADPRIDLAEAFAAYRLGDYGTLRNLASAAAANGKRMGADLIVARARHYEGSGLQDAGDHKGAMAAFAEARSLFEQAGDERGMARVLEGMATSLHLQGDLGGSHGFSERALAIFQRLGDQLNEARVLNNLGKLNRDQGETLLAESRFEEALKIFREIGALYEAAISLTEQGASLHLSGWLQEAQQKYQEALGVFEQTGERRWVAAVLTNLAEVRFLRGDLEEALRLHEEALSIDLEFGDTSAEAYDRYRLGLVFSAIGDLAVARTHLEQAVAAQVDLGETIAAAESRVALAALELAQGRAGEAVTLAKESEEFLRTEGVPDVQALALAMMGRASLALGRDAEALKLVTRASELAADSEDPRVRFSTAIAEALVRYKRGGAEVTAALESLEQVAAEGGSLGYVAAALEARIEAAEIDLVASPSAEKRAYLGSLRDEAREAGYGLLARRAAAALGG
jgi:serine/threonine protein kinase/tetratricopeptide (TPR) repeat protein